MTGVQTCALPISVNGGIRTSGRAGGGTEVPAFLSVGTSVILIGEQLIAALLIPGFPILAALLEEGLGVVIPAVEVGVLCPVAGVPGQFIAQKTQALVGSAGAASCQRLHAEDAHASHRVLPIGLAAFGAQG